MGKSLIVLRYCAQRMSLRGKGSSHKGSGNTLRASKPFAFLLMRAIAARRRSGVEQ